MDYSHHAPLPMELPRQEYWNGSHSLLQGIFLTQGSNTTLLHCGQILYHLTITEAQYDIKLVGYLEICKMSTGPGNWSASYTWKLLRNSNAHKRVWLLSCNMSEYLSLCGTAKLSSRMTAPFTHQQCMSGPASLHHCQNLVIMSNFHLSH